MAGNKIHCPGQPSGLCHAICLDPLTHNGEIRTTSSQLLLRVKACHHKLYSIAQDRICKPHEQGGLAILNLRQLNLIYIAKLGLRFVKQQALWRQIVEGKYGTLSANLLEKPILPKSSYTWRSMSKGFSILVQGLQWATDNPP